MKNRKLLIVCLLFFVAIILPYGVGFGHGDDLYQFNGFLLNPIDGHTYLAKMGIGVSGDWRFHLPYSIEQGGGAFLFLFYIFLGHTAKLLNIETILLFHGARVVSALILVFAISRTVRKISSETGIPFGRAFFLALFGSGLGWLFVGAGIVTSDLWVAEAYPFLSAYTNPHFPLGIGLMLEIFLKLSEDDRQSLILVSIFNLLLAIILPFGVVIVTLVAVCWGTLQFIENRKITWKQAIAFVPGGGFVLYQYWATLSDPVLSVWNQQNQTGAPAIIDLIISFSPLLLLAIPGAWLVIRGKEKGLIRLMAFWFLVGVVLIFVPINIQRRFLTGLMIPVVMLSEYVIRNIRFKFPIMQKIVQGAGYSTLPTLGVVLLLGLIGIMSYVPAYFIKTSEVAGLDWIKRKTPENSIILASPVSGLDIPAYTGRKVLYGHPYETVNAVERKDQVEKFFGGDLTLNDLEKSLNGQKVNYIFWGSGEKNIGIPDLSGFVSVFKINDVEIFKAH